MSDTHDQPHLAVYFHHQGLDELVIIGDEAGLKGLVATIERALHHDGNREVMNVYPTVKPPWSVLVARDDLIPGSQLNPPANNASRRYQSALRFFGEVVTEAERRDPADYCDALHTVMRRWFRNYGPGANHEAG